MTALTEDGTKGSYIGQHKIGRKCPLEDGYKGSGKAWKKYILQKNVPTEKVILRMCDNIEQANYWEKYYIKQAKEDGIYLWNRTIGGEAHEHNKQYTDQELKQHKKQYNQQYGKQYRDAHRKKITEYHKQWHETNKEKIAEYHKQWHEANKEQQRQYREANKEQYKQYYKQYNQQYYNQPCLYNGEMLTINALRKRFIRAGITNSTAEAKKYLITNI